jgi:hypothetical protein
VCVRVCAIVWVWVGRWVGGTPYKLVLASMRTSLVLTAYW